MGRHVLEASDMKNKNNIPCAKTQTTPGVVPRPLDLVTPTPEPPQAPESTQIPITEIF